MYLAESENISGMEPLNGSAPKIRAAFHFKTRQYTTGVENLGYAKEQNSISESIAIKKVLESSKFYFNTVILRNCYQNLTYSNRGPWKLNASKNLLLAFVIKKPKSCIDLQLDNSSAPGHHICYKQIIHWRSIAE